MNNQHGENQLNSNLENPMFHTEFIPEGIIKNINLSKDTFINMAVTLQHMRDPSLEKRSGIIKEIIIPKKLQDSEVEVTDYTFRVELDDLETKKIVRVGIASIVFPSEIKEVKQTSPGVVVINGLNIPAKDYFEALHDDTLYDIAIMNGIMAARSDEALSEYSKIMNAEFEYEPELQYKSDEIKIVLSSKKKSLDYYSNGHLLEYCD